MPEMQKMLVLSLGQEDPLEEKTEPIQYPCLVNTMDRGAWWATVHGGLKASDMTDGLSMHSCCSDLQITKTLMYFSNMEQEDRGRGTQGMCGFGSPGLEGRRCWVCLPIFPEHRVKSAVAQRGDGRPGGERGVAREARSHPPVAAIKGRSSPGSLIMSLSPSRGLIQLQFSSQGIYNNVGGVHCILS